VRWVPQSDLPWRFHVQDKVFACHCVPRGGPVAVLVSATSMRADLQSDEDDWRATGHGGYFLEAQDCTAARLVDQNETMWNYGSGISKLPGTRARGARRLAMYAVIGAAAVMMACFASAGRGEQHGPTETAARQWTELMENADLCATQVGANASFPESTCCTTCR